MHKVSQDSVLCWYADLTNLSSLYLKLTLMTLGTAHKCDAYVRHDKSITYFILMSSIGAVKV